MGDYSIHINSFNSKDLPTQYLRRVIVFLKHKPQCLIIYKTERTGDLRSWRTRVHCICHPLEYQTKNTMAVLSSTKNEALRLKSVPSSQKHEWARLTGSNEPITYSMNLCLISLVYAIWLVLKRWEEYFSPAGQKKAGIIDSRNSISSSSQEKLDEDEDEDGLFSEQRIGEHHRMAIRKFGKLWEQLIQPLS